MTYFKESRAKIERAEKHINDIESILKGFDHTDFYKVRINKNVDSGANSLSFEIDNKALHPIGLALPIGDALHNLRSTLDLLWYLIIDGHSKFTRFPIRDTRESLVDTLGTALKKQQITPGIYSFMLDTVQPYETGNDALWGMDDLNIRDKHQLLIPNFHAMLFTNIRLKDKNTGELIDLPPILNDRSGDIRLREYFDRDLELYDKGHGSATIIFNIGVPFQGEAIVPRSSRSGK